MEVDKLKKEVQQNGTGGDLKAKQLEDENAKLKNQVAELQQRISEKDASLSALERNVNILFNLIILKNLTKLLIISTFFYYIMYHNLYIETKS